MFGHTFKISPMTAGELHSERFILTFGSEVVARHTLPSSKVRIRPGRESSARGPVLLRSRTAFRRSHSRCLGLIQLGAAQIGITSACFGLRRLVGLPQRPEWLW